MINLFPLPGPDTKLMQNCGKTTLKRTSIDRLMNVLVLSVSMTIHTHTVITHTHFLTVVFGLPDLWFPDDYVFNPGHWEWDLGIPGGL